MATTPLYKALKANGVTTYALPGAQEDISQAYQNDNYRVNFSKFVLLNMNLDNMNLDNDSNFNTESFNVYNDKGTLLVNHLRNYVANHEVVIKNSTLNNNESFYDPNVLRTTTEKIFFKWLRKTGGIEFEPAIPNDEYIDVEEFAVDDNLPEDYFKEYLWKERSIIDYNIVDIQDTGIDRIDPHDNQQKRVYRVETSSATNIKPNDRIRITNDGNINIGFTGEKDFTVERIETSTDPNNESKNNWVYIFSDITLVYNNFAVASLKLLYDKVVKYLGEISSINNVQNENRSYTEVLAYIPDQNGATPDVLFRTSYDTNYSPGLQYPILPSQEQPEIIGGEQSDSPIVLMPENYPGDQYAYFDVDQNYQNSSGFQNRRRGEYFGVLENNRNAQRVSQAPYVYPEFDGSQLDGIGIDFEPDHYVKMNLPNRQASNFDEFNSLYINEQPPSDFEFNAILWYYEVEDLTSDDNDVALNLYGITFVNPEENGNIEPYTKLVSKENQDGLSYQFNLNLNFSIDNDTSIEYTPDKTYSLFGFNLYNKVMREVGRTNDIFNQLAVDVTQFRQELSDLRSLVFTQSDINDINFRIDRLQEMLNMYQSLQIQDTDSISTQLDESTSPPQLRLRTTDARFGDSVKLPVSLLYNNQNNTVIDYNINVPDGKDFLVNVINDDNSDITLDRDNLNIVLDRDLDYKQTCEINIYPNNASFNKKLNISILTNLVNNINNQRGYQLFNEPFDLPIDNNLNANVEIDSILERWNQLPEQIFPEKLKIRKIANNYFIVVEMRGMQINAFRNGDVLMLENFHLVYDNIEADISGQYQISGEIENNELIFQVNNENFQNLFDTINSDMGNATTHELANENITQPAFVRFNSGYKIKITANDRVSSDLNEKYLIEIHSLKKEDIN